MQVRWWQSIRWRLTLGSILASLLATTLLAISVIVAINYYYGVDQRQRLITLASDTAQRLGVSYAQNGTLAAAVASVLPNTPAQSMQNQEYLLLVLNNSRPLKLLYPYNRPGTALVSVLLATTDPTAQKGDFTRLLQALANARHGVSTVGDIGQTNPGASPRLFAVQPVFGGENERRVLKQAGHLLVQHFLEARTGEVEHPPGDFGSLDRL